MLQILTNCLATQKQLNLNDCLIESIYFSLSLSPSTRSFHANDSRIVLVLSALRDCVDCTYQRLAARRSFSLSLASRQSRHTSSSRRVFAVQRLLSPGNRAIYTAYTHTYGTYIKYTYYLVLESLHFAVVHTHTDTRD